MVFKHVNETLTWANKEIRHRALIQDMSFEKTIAEYLPLINSLEI